MLNKNRRFTAYKNYGSSTLWTIVIVDYNWWNSNLDKLREWFEFNFPNITISPDTVLISFKTDEEYTMWRLAWE